MQFGSVDAVIAAIRDDAQAEAEKIARDGDRAVARLRDDEAHRPPIDGDRQMRIAAARREALNRIAIENAADRLAALDVRESWMARIAAEGARMLSEIGGADLRADLIRFIAEAVERLPAGPVEVHVAAASLHLAETAADDPLLARHRTNITRIVADESVTSGCVVQTLDGRIRFDNSYEARARRSEAVWRARLGQLFERDVMAAQRAPLAEAAR